MQDFGLLAPFMADPAVTEIMVRDPEHAFVIRGGVMEPVDVSWPNGDALFDYVADLVRAAGWPLDLTYEDAKDGARIIQRRLAVNANVEGGLLTATRPPVTPAVTLTIRKGRSWNQSDIAG